MTRTLRIDRDKLSLKSGFGWLVIFCGLGLLTSLGCSLGTLIVQVPTPTTTPFKTPQATFTHTPVWTPTFTPTPTPIPTDTPTPAPTITPTSLPTEEEAESGEATEPAPPAEEAAAEAPPPAPVDTPTPAGPAPTATPAFPFNIVFSTHDTGSPGETRITGWVRIDYEPGKFKTLSGFRMKALAPDGNTYFSEVSGSGPGDSTVPGTGDNHLMNTKLEIRPYTAGAYKLFLVEGEEQVSPEIEFTLSADPRQYIHFDFFKQE